MSMLEMTEREITFSQAINEALSEEMRRDESVFIIGEDVAEAGTPFKVLSGLVEEFGTERVIDSPISESGFTGIGVGAAMTGMRFTYFRVWLHRHWSWGCHDRYATCC